MTQASLFTDIMFWVIAVSSIVAAIAVVQLRDMFRAALFLVVCFLGVAGMFVLLGAEFLAAVQVLIYVGAISVLIIFAVLMTADVEEGSPSHGLRIPVGVLAALFAAMAIFVAVATEWNPIATEAQAENAQAPVTADDSGTTENVAAVSTNTVDNIEEIFFRHYSLDCQAVDAGLRTGLRGCLRTTVGVYRRCPGTGQGTVTL